MTAAGGRGASHVAAGPAVSVKSIEANLEGKRMKRLVMAMAVVLGLAAVAPMATAHEGHGLTFGEVTSVSGDTFEVKTAKTTMTLKITADTKFEKAGKSAERALLKKGERVGVDAKKAESGELLATRVVLGVPAPAASKD